MTTELLDQALELSIEIKGIDDTLKDFNWLRSLSYVDKTFLANIEGQIKDHLLEKMQAAQKKFDELGC